MSTVKTHFKLHGGNQDHYETHVRQKKTQRDERPVKTYISAPSLHELAFIGAPQRIHPCVFFIWFSLVIEISFLFQQRISPHELKAGKLGALLTNSSKQRKKRKVNRRDGGSMYVFHWKISIRFKIKVMDLMKWIFLAFFPWIFSDSVFFGFFS